MSESIRLDGMGGKRKAKVQLAVGDLVEIDGQPFEVDLDKFGFPTLETPITPTAELHRRRGTQPASEEDFERFAGDLPTDDEG
jgi:hypothetical protein